MQEAIQMYWWQLCFVCAFIILAHVKCMHTQAHIQTVAPSPHTHAHTHHSLICPSLCHSHLRIHSYRNPPGELSHPHTPPMTDPEAKPWLPPPQITLNYACFPMKYYSIVPKFYVQHNSLTCWLSFVFFRNGLTSLSFYNLRYIFIPFPYPLCTYKWLNQ